MFLQASLPHGKRAATQPRLATCLGLNVQNEKDFPPCSDCSGSLALPQHIPHMAFIRVSDSNCRRANGCHPERAQLQQASKQERRSGRQKLPSEHYFVEGASVLITYIACIYIYHTPKFRTSRFCKGRTKRYFENNVAYRSGQTHSTSYNVIFGQKNGPNGT